jgi:hypothetical protein
MRIPCKNYGRDVCRCPALRAERPTGKAVTQRTQRKKGENTEINADTWQRAPTTVTKTGDRFPDQKRGDAKGAKTATHKEDAEKDEALDSQASKVQFTDGFNDLVIGAE